MGSKPLYLTEEQTTEAQIRNRVLSAFPSGMRTNQGSFAWDNTAGPIVELTEIGIALRYALEVGFVIDEAGVRTTFSTYLRRRTAESGVDWEPAKKATLTLEVSGVDGTVVPIGTRASTAAAVGSPAVAFETTQIGTISGGVALIEAEAVIAGAAGNVGMGTVTFLSAPIVGVTGVTNTTAGTGGENDETDDELLTRYLEHVRNISAGGNRGDYLKWSRAVAGVGGVSVAFPAEGTPPVPDGNVRIALIGIDKAPATLAVQDAVLSYIVDPHRLGPYEAEAFTLSGNGVSIDATQVDDQGDSVKLVHDAVGAGTATHQRIDLLLPQTGIWMAKPRIKVNSAAGATPFLRVGVWNLSTGNWAKSRPQAADGTAVYTFRANELPTAFPDATYDLLWPSIDFYANGLEQLELRVTRLQDDNATHVWLDRVRYRSANSKDTVETAKAPGTHRVQVIAATAVPITVNLTSVIKPGFSKPTVDAAIVSNITSYIQSLAGASNNDVQYARIGTTILDTEGVQDYTGLTVNGGTANIVILADQVATVGAVNVT